MALELSPQELDVILAALRFWQSYAGPGDAEWVEIATAHGPALGIKAIDGLCERLNT